MSNDDDLMRQNMLTLLHNVILIGLLALSLRLLEVIASPVLFDNVILDTCDVVARNLLPGHGYLGRCRQLIRDSNQFELHDGFVPGYIAAEFFQRTCVVAVPYMSAATSGVLTTTCRMVNERQIRNVPQTWWPNERSPSSTVPLTEYVRVPEGETPTRDTEALCEAALWAAYGLGRQRHILQGKGNDERLSSCGTTVAPLFV